MNKSRQLDYEHNQDTLISSKEEIAKEFNIDINDIKDIELLFASYSCDGIDGDIAIVFRKDNKLFLVVGGHCSCDGLEGQWDPEEVTLEELKHFFVKKPDLLEPIIKAIEKTDVPELDG